MAPPSSHPDAQTPLPTTRWGEALSKTHPYYLVAQGYRSGHLPSRQLHILCSLLNHWGYPAWIVTSDVSHHLWTPKVSDAVRASHHRAGRVPLVLVADPSLAKDASLGIRLDYRLAPPAAAVANGPHPSPAIVPLGSWQLVPRASVTPGVSPQAAEHGPLPLPFWPPAWERVAPGADTGRTTLLAWAPDEAGLSWPEGTLVLKQRELQDDLRLWALLRQARVLLLGGPHDALSLAARWAGCPVLHISPQHPGPSAALWPLEGVATLAAVPPLSEVPAWSADAFRQKALDELAGWPEAIQTFVQRTQAQARSTPVAEAWPEEIVLSLPPSDEGLPAQAERADRIKALRVNQQLERWRERSSLREIDADVYAQHLAGNTLPAISAVVFAEDDVDALADTLDSLSQSWLQPSHVTVVSLLPAPFSADEATPGLSWFVANGGDSISRLQHLLASPWVLALRAGTLLERHALVEWALAAQRTEADLIYADDDVFDGNRYTQPQFKPHANPEWLRSCNHLGEAVLLRASLWQEPEVPLRWDGIYALALRLLETRGRAGFWHIDSLLAHTRGVVTAPLLEAERQHLRLHFERLGWTAVVQAGGVAGVHRVHYRGGSAACTLLVPSATQTGYLNCLLQSLLRYPSSRLTEVLIVCDGEHEPLIRDVVQRLPAHSLAVRVIPIANQPYHHARALNAGLAAVRTELVLIADDDTELVHSGWDQDLLGYFQQPDVAVVAPRLVKPGAPEPVLAGGPVFLGVQALMASYCGESGNVLEAGPYGRLQGAQDVSAWLPHCFVARTAALRELGGFDESFTPVLLPVAHLALRLQQTGWRAIWTPLVSVLHQGGKTLEERHRLPQGMLAHKQTELQERQRFIQHWTHALGSDPHYNRNLSLAVPFDLEQDIVVDWQPTRRDRPRALALPISSGSGQYRVIEPLDALQKASLAQSVVVLPVSRDISRVPTPVEIIRSRPDCLIVQNAIGDLHLARLEEYRTHLPELPIIHMMDDLFGDLPGKHHLHQFHKREGNARVRRALELTDRLIVTTEPLRDYYQAHVPEVRIVPNALVEANWFDLPVTRRPRERGRLRVGWAGAQQHLGDLDMIADIVAHFAPRVDWVFMGMCPPSIRPHVKEIHPFVSISVYPQTLANLDLDIAIAPLEDNAFNTCKSNLRLLEYGAMGWPVVCSDMYPYRTANPPVVRVANQKNEWIDALQRLIDDKTRRQELGSALNHWVKSNFALSLHVDAWFRAIFDPIR